MLVFGLSISVAVVIPMIEFLMEKNPKDLSAMTTVIPDTISCEL